MPKRTTVVQKKMILLNRKFSQIRPKIANFRPSSGSKIPKMLGIGRLNVSSIVLETVSSAINMKRNILTMLLTEQRQNILGVFLVR